MMATDRTCHISKGRHTMAPKHKVVACGSPRAGQASGVGDTRKLLCPARQALRAEGRGLALGIKAKREVPQMRTEESAHAAKIQAQRTPVVA